MFYGFYYLCFLFFLTNWKSNMWCFLEKNRVLPSTVHNSKNTSWKEELLLCLSWLWAKQGQWATLQTRAPEVRRQSGHCWWQNGYKWKTHSVILFSFVGDQYIYIHLQENGRTHLCHLCVSGLAMWIYTHWQIMRVLIPLISRGISALVHFQLLAWHSTSHRFVHTMRLAKSRAF